MYWIISVLALIGVWLNIHKKRACFYIWSATNAAWVYVDLEKEIYPQAALMAVYFALAIYGIFKWR